MTAAANQSARLEGRLAGLDLLRLLAALAVVAFHYLYRGAAGDDYLATAFPEVERIAWFGYLGVNLFFLISGFVIARTADGRTVSQFSVARFARLYPGFVACMSLTFLFLLTMGDPRFPVGWSQFGTNLTMFAPAFGQPFMDGVYWSIVRELIFYGWVALAIATGLFERHMNRIVLVWLIVGALNEFLFQNGALRILFLTEYGPLFAFGMLLHRRLAERRDAETLLLMVAAFLMSSNTLSVSRDWMLAHYGEAPGMAPLLAANILMHGMLVAGVLLGARLRPSATLLALGGLTYPLYLLHQHVGYLLIDAGAPLLGRWGALAATVAAMLVLSWAVWRYLEPPGRMLAKNIGNATAGRMEATAAIVLPARSPEHAE